MIYEPVAGGSAAAIAAKGLLRQPLFSRAKGETRDESDQAIGRRASDYRPF